MVTNDDRCIFFTCGLTGWVELGPKGTGHVLLSTLDPLL